MNSLGAFKLSPVGGAPTGAAAVGSVPTAHNILISDNLKCIQLIYKERNYLNFAALVKISIGKIFFIAIYTQNELRVKK